MSASCAHCGLPVRGAESEDSALFCCFGCRLAYEVWGGDEVPAGSLAGGILARLMLGIFFAMAAMVFSTALYAGSLFPVQPGSDHALGPLAEPFRWLAIGFATPVLLLLGSPLLSHNVVRFERGPGVWPVNLLILVGVCAAYLFSLINAWRGTGEIYIETVVMVLVLVTLGRFLDARARYRATSSVRDLLTLDPDVAWRVALAKGPTTPTRTTPAALNPGDFVLVKAGERIPVDGDVVHGQGEVDQSLLTGEAAQRHVATGSALFAGSRLLDGAVTLECKKTVGSRLLDRLAALADASREHRTALERLSERSARWFLPLSVVIAAGTVVYWSQHGDPESALLHGLAVLLVSCPCALGIASPLATWVAVGRAARHGVLVHDTALLEALARGGGHAFLDKTGTLTSSRLEVCGVLVAPGRTPEELLHHAASVAQLSGHPVSDAIRRYAHARGVEPASVEGFSTTIGHGIEGQIGETHVRVGSANFVPGEAAALALEAPASTQDGRVFVAADGRALGALFVREELRPEAPQAIAQLEDLGYPVEVLTGDSARQGMALAERLGVPVHAALDPEAKLRRVENAPRSGPRLVVGDGLNDAPVLAAADVAVAMGTGTQIARDAAGIVLMENATSPLLGLPYLVRLARTTMRRIRFNLFWAFGYNAIGIGSAATGHLHPVVAVALMITSSLFVVLSSIGTDSVEAGP